MKLEKHIFLFLTGTDDLREIGMVMQKGRGENIALICGATEVVDYWLTALYHAMLKNGEKNRLW